MAEQDEENRGRPEQIKPWVMVRQLREREQLGPGVLHGSLHLRAPRRFWTDDPSRTGRRLPVPGDTALR